MSSVRRAIAALAAITVALGFAGVAEAATGTAAGTVINNTASVTYTVNGTNQSANSTTASFVVDKKVNFSLVTDQVGYTQVNLGQTNAVVSFKLTNTTNDTQDFLLESDQQTISVGILTGTDNFDMLNLKAYVDSNGNGVYDPGVDTQTYVDELAPDASVEVFLVGDAPTTPTALLAFVSMHVTVAAGGAAGTKGTALVATDLTTANSDSTVDIVFADDDSDGPLYAGDIARNGQSRAYGGYQVGTHNVSLTVTKSARVVSDGVNLINPKAIPGATVEYCLLVNNATLTTAANNVNLADILPVKTTYVANSILIGTPGVPGVSCVLSGAASGSTFTSSYDSPSRTVSAHLDAVAGGASIAVAFQATIN